MANYANNYRGTNPDLPCKLCSNHQDKQEEIYICDYNKKNVNLQGSYEDLFKSDVDATVSKSLEALYKLREKQLSWAKPGEDYYQVHAFCYPWGQFLQCCKSQQTLSFVLFLNNYCIVNSDIWLDLIYIYMYRP